MDGYKTHRDTFKRIIRRQAALALAAVLLLNTALPTVAATSETTDGELSASEESAITGATVTPEVTVAPETDDQDVEEAEQTNPEPGGSDAEETVEPAPETDGEPAEETIPETDDKPAEETIPETEPSENMAGQTPEQEGPDASEPPAQEDEQADALLETHLTLRGDPKQPGYVRLQAENNGSREAVVRLSVWKGDERFATVADWRTFEKIPNIVPQVRDLDAKTGTLTVGDVVLTLREEADARYLEFTMAPGEKNDLELFFDVSTEKLLYDLDAYITVEAVGETEEADEVAAPLHLEWKAGDSSAAATTNGIAMIAAGDSAINFDYLNNYYTDSVAVTGQTVVYLQFTPRITHEYVFYSTGSADTYGYLYNANKTQITYNDDGGSGTNFRIAYTLTAGVTYYWGVRYYSASSKGDITVHLESTNLNLVPEDGGSATCTEAGESIFRCLHCQRTITEIMPPLGHIVSEESYQIIQEPTCTREGTYSGYCTRCGETVTDAVEPLGHTYDEGVAQVESCTQESYTILYTCTREECTDEEEGHTMEVLVAHAPGHDFDENGVCRRCGERGTKVILQVVNPLNSSYVMEGFSFGLYASTDKTESSSYTSYAYDGNVLSVVKEDGGGFYHTWVNFETESVDGMFAFKILGTPAGYENLSGDAAYGDFTSADIQTDGIVYIGLGLTKPSGFGPIYIEAYVYDSVTGVGVNGATLDLVTELLDTFDPAQGVGPEYTWNSYTEYAAFYEYIYGDGSYLYASTSAYDGLYAYSYGGTTGQCYRVAVLAAPEGYSTALDKEQSLDTMEILPEYPGYSSQYASGSSNVVKFNLYLMPQAALESTLCDMKTNAGIPDVTWALYADEECTIPILDVNGDHITGVTDASGRILTDGWFDFDWTVYGQTAYIQLSDYDTARYTGEMTVRPIELAPAAATRETVYLSPYAEEVSLVVTVVDHSQPEGEQLLPGRTLTVYEYDAQLGDYSQTPLGTLTDNGDGTYSGLILTETDDNAGEFRVVDDETGTAASFTISDTYDDEIHVVLNLSSYGSLPDILKRDPETGAYLGDVDIVWNDTILDSTNPDKPAYPGAIGWYSSLQVKFYGLQVDENLVEDNVIYTYVLPPELVPVMENTSDNEVIGESWLALNKQGRVRAYGRIVCSGELYVFEVYFTHTVGQYDIEFGYAYNATVSPQYKDGGRVDVTFLEKELHFNITETPQPKPLSLTKSAQWVYDSNHDWGTNSSSWGGSTYYNQMQFTVTLTNLTGENVTATLNESFNSTGMMMRYDNSDTFPIEFYVDFGSGFEKVALARNNSYGARYDSNSYPASELSFNVSSYTSYGSWYYATDGFTVTLNNFRFEALKIVYYVDPYYASSNGSFGGSSYRGSSDFSYGASTSMTLSSPSLQMGEDYDTYVSAYAYKTYSGFGSGLYMTQYNQTNGYSYDPNYTSYGSSYGKYSHFRYNDYSSRVEFSITGLNSGGESWFAFEEVPFGSDWAYGPSNASRNYYFHGADFTNDSNGNLRNSVVVEVNGTDILYYSSKVTAGSMLSYDWKSFLELGTLLSESGYNINNYYGLPTYQCSVYINGVYRTIWVVVSPETWDNANPGSSRYGAGVLPKNGSGEYNIPAGIKLYVLGLTGGESLSFYYAKYQRTLTTTPANIYSSNGVFYNHHQYSNGYTQYVGSVFYGYNRYYRFNTSQYETDQGDEALLAKEGELLADGSVKWTITMDVTKLRRFYQYGQGTYYQGYYQSNYPYYVYLYDVLPELRAGTASDYSAYYDENFNRVSSAGSATYQIGRMYIMDSSGQKYATIDSWFAPTSYIGGPYAKILNNAGRSIDACISFPLSTLLNTYYTTDSSTCKDYVTLVYITGPGTYCNLESADSLSSSGVNNLYSATELLIGWSNSNGYSPSVENVLVDTVASCYVPVPGISKKSMTRVSNTATRDDENKYDCEWVANLEVDLFNGSYISWDRPNKQPYFFNGTISLYDTMRGMTVMDMAGNVLVEDAAKYVRLDRIDYSLSANTYPYTSGGTLYISDENIVASGDAGMEGAKNDTLLEALHYGYDLASVPKYGFNRYQYMDKGNGITFNVDYAPSHSLYEDETSSSRYYEDEGILYGGENYGMYGGFEIFLSGVEEGTHISFTYYLTFDYEAFAAAYPDLGKVNITMTNAAIRNYTAFKKDTYPVNSKAQSWMFAVSPALVKKAGAGTADTYGRQYTIEADVGATGRDAVYVVDQITAVRDIQSGNLFTADGDPDILSAWLDCLYCSGFRVEARSRTNPGYKEIVCTDAVIKNGEITAEVADGWKLEAADPSLFAEVPVEGENAVSLNGNLFALELGRSDDDQLDPSVYFVITYTLYIDQARVGQELMAAFRQLGEGYSGGQVNLSNQAVICYLTTQEIPGGDEPVDPEEPEDPEEQPAAINGVMPLDLGGSVEESWVASGSITDATFLQQGSSSKGGQLLYADEGDDKERFTGTSTYHWYLKNTDWSAGTNAWLQHDWNDFLFVTAMLDSLSADDEYRGLGDETLNAAWVNLFYKHMTVTDFQVTAASSLSTYATHDLQFMGVDASGNLVFRDSAANADGSYLEVVIKPDALESGDGTTWNIKKRSNTYMNEDAELYDPWGIGWYLSGYYTQEQVQAMKASGELPSSAKNYGYGVNHLFDVAISNEDYLTEVTVHYNINVNWTALFAEADSLRLAEVFLGYYEQHRENFTEAFQKVMDEAIRRQEELDALSDELGLTGNDRLSLGLFDLPIYAEVLNEGLEGGEPNWGSSDWGYPAEASGNISKQASTNEDGSVDWTVTLTVVDKAIVNVVLDDTMTPQSNLEQAIRENTAIALKHLTVSDFVIEDGTTGQILYTCDGGSGGTIGTAEGVFENGRVTFSRSGKLFILRFDRVMANQTLVIRYRTTLDQDAFAADGGNLDKDIAVNNTALVSSVNWTGSADANGRLTPDVGTDVQKEAFEYGLLNETGYHIEAYVGEVDATWLSMEDHLQANPEDILDYIRITSMLITLANTDGDEIIIYDSLGGINLLSDYHFTLNEDFACGVNGVNGFVLTFNEQKKNEQEDNEQKDNEQEEEEIVLPKGTKLLVDYTICADEDGYRADGNKGKYFTLTNYVDLNRNSADTRTGKVDDTLTFEDTIRKEGRVLGTDADGNTRIQWTIDLYLTQMFTQEELALAETVTVTDILPSLDLVRYEEGSLRVYELDKAGNLGNIISDSEYEVEIVGRQVIVTLQEPAKRPYFRVYLDTVSPAGVSGISNQAKLTLLGKEVSTETPEISTTGDRKGYVQSRAHTGTVQLFKTDAFTGQALADAVFALYHVTCGNTSANHTHTDACWSHVSYLIREMAQDGHYYNYDVDYNKNNGGDKLWQYDLITDEQGDLVIVGLPFGTYRLVEVKAPVGYHISEQAKQPFEFTINNALFDGETQEAYVFRYNLQNAPNRVTVYKYCDETLGGHKVHSGLRGTKLEIWSADKTRKLAEAVTGADGYASFDYLPAGSYVLVEAAAPTGFLLAKDIPFVLGEDGAITVDSLYAGTDETGAMCIRMQDTLVAGSIRITKTGEVVRDLGWLTRMWNYLVHAFDWAMGRLSDVTFNVYAGEDITLCGVTVFAKDQLIAAITTDAAGVAVLEHLPAGRYYAVEQQTQDSYLLDPTPIEFELVLGYDTDGNPVMNSYTDAEFINDRKNISLKLLKSDAQSGQPLANATFGLYAAVDESVFSAGDLLDVATTDAQGKAVFTVSLPAGEYYLQEIAAPMGYVRSDEKYPIVLNGDTADNTVIERTAENVPRKLCIAKVDENGNLLAGCVLKLVDEDGHVVARWLSSAETEQELSGIPEGIYTLIEEKAAAGYQLAKNIVITVLADDTILHVTMQDERVPQNVPKTGDTSCPEVWLSLLLGSLTGMLLISGAYVRRRKKKK